MNYAHSSDDATRSNWQPLSDHLTSTANLAELFGARCGLGRVARLAGLLHDLGKYTPQFEARLTGAPEKVDHSTAGASIVIELAKTGKADDRLVAELVAYAIAGHHAGLPDKLGPTFSTLSQRLEDFVGTNLDPVWKTEIAPDVTGLLPDFKWERQDKQRAAFQLGFMGRMIFSCLVDADFKDTERFYARINPSKEADRNWPELQTALPGLLAAFDAHMGKKRNADSPVNVLRGDILDHVRAQATLRPGLFTLTVPTGGGKTLATLGFALDHANAYGHRRIIYTIPFTGAWIETGARRHPPPSPPSLLTRERGSKR